jgi:hypothetical protein
VLENYVGLSKTTVHRVLKKMSTFYFQQDGAPAHYAKSKWKQWPPRSPDLTPLDFYFLGYVKQIVYSVRIHNIQHLKQRIREAAASVTPDVLGRVCQEVEYRLDVCRATNGAHIEL